MYQLIPTSRVSNGLLPYCGVSPRVVFRSQDLHYEEVVVEGPSVKIGEYTVSREALESGEEALYMPKKYFYTPEILNDFAEAGWLVVRLR